jgi:hypothetical protein
MAEYLKDIVDVTVNDLTAAAREPSFDLILIMSTEGTFASKTLECTSLEDVAAAVTGGVTSESYKAATAIFSQNPSPSKILLGRTFGIETIVQGLTAIKAVNDDWYGFVVATSNRTDKDESEAVASWAAANKKLLSLTQSDGESQNVTDDVTSAAKTIYSANNKYVILVNDKDNYTTQYVDAGILAKLLLKRPGTYTGNLQQLENLLPTYFTTAQRSNAHSKFLNTYEKRMGVNVFQQGFVSGSSYADLTIYKDYIKAKIEVEMFNLLLKNDKLPMEPTGLSLVKSRLNKVFSLEQTAGAITQDNFDDDGVRIGGYEIIMPSFEDISLSDKAARSLKNIVCNIFYSNAIHNFKITINVNI